MSLPWPSYPSYSRVPPDEYYKLYRVSAEHNIFVQLERRVVCSLRVLAARRTPEECSGSHYAGMDIFVAHGAAVTPYYYWQKNSRFDGAYIIDESSRRTHSDVHARLATLPAVRTQGEKVYKNCTHIHLVTIHKDEAGEPYKLVFADDVLYKCDLHFVKVVQVIDGVKQTLATGSDRFGTLECPWMIPTKSLADLETFDERDLESCS